MTSSCILASAPSCGGRACVEDSLNFLKDIYRLLDQSITETESTDSAPWTLEPHNCEHLVRSFLGQIFMGELLPPSLPRRESSFWTSPPLDWMRSQKFSSAILSVKPTGDHGKSPSS